MNLGDYFEQVEFHTEFNSVDQMLDAQASDLAKISINDLKSLVDDYHAGRIHSVDEFNREFLKFKKESRMCHDFLEQSGLVDFVPVDPIRYIRCGHCRWHWQPGTSFDNKCPRCGFVAMLQTYKMQIRQEEPSPKQEQEKESGNYIIEIERFLHTDKKTLTESLGIPQPFRVLIAVSFSVKSGKITIQEAETRINEIMEVLVTYGYKSIVSGLANIEKHFPAIAEEEAGMLSSIRKNTEKNKADLQKVDRKCFIATAVYGTPNAWEVAVLRSWRDKFLRRFTVGRLFICLYESISPPVAIFVGRHFWARCVCRSVIHVVAVAIKLSFYHPD
jgi:phage FluMu protein Com